MIRRLRKAVLTREFTGLAEPGLDELRRQAVGATVLRAVFGGDETLLTQRGLSHAQREYIGALAAAWDAVPDNVLIPGRLADFAGTERRLRVNRLRDQSRAWADFVTAEYARQAPNRAWELQAGPRIWSKLSRDLTPAGLSRHELVELQPARDATVAHLTLSDLAISGLALEAQAIRQGIQARSLAERNELLLTA